MKGEIGLMLVVLLPIIGSFVCRYLTELGERGNRKGMLRCGEWLFFGLSSVTLALAVWFGVRALLGRETALLIPEVCGFGLSMRLCGFRILYLILAAFAWTVSGVFALWYMEGEHAKGRYFFYTLFTMGATLGVFLSDDLYTLFIFFEMMSMASYVWVVQEEDEDAVRASKTYLAVAVIGGLVMLMGIFLLAVNTSGDLSFENLYAAFSDIRGSKVYYAAGFCLLFGFGAKAGAFPLHIWLPKAHPVAPAPASALLSGILTKAGMFGILLLTGKYFFCDAFFGKILLLLAVCTMLVGAVEALFSVDMKHILACSSVSQIGFMLVGAAAMCIMKSEQQLGGEGAILHMVNHSLFKLVLFLVAGICVKNLKSRDLNVLRGFGAKRPWLMIVFLFAALGITGIPGFSGFVSKSMLHESILICYAESGSILYKAAELLFLTAGGCTFAYMLKLFVILFFDKPSEEVLAFNRSGKCYLPTAVKVVLTIPAGLVYLFGILPEFTMLPIARKAFAITDYYAPEEYFKVFTWENVKGGIISVVIGLAVYFLLVRPVISKKTSSGKGKKRAVTVTYVNRFPQWLDMEKIFYRPFLLQIFPKLFGGLCAFAELLTESVSGVFFAAAKLLCGLFDKLPEMFVIGTRRTVLKPVCELPQLSASQKLCSVIGRFCNGIAAGWRKLFRRNKPSKDYVESVTRGFNDASETVKLISRSLSYGLLAFCIGLLAMLFYLLYCLKG